MLNLRNSKYPRPDKSVIVDPRLPDGRETLDERPTVVYMQFDEDTGEVTREGRPMPMTVEQLYNQSVARNLAFDEYADEDDDDFDEPEYDDTLIPELTPHQEGFIERYGPSEAAAMKILKKAGYAVVAPDEDIPSETSSPEAKKSVKKAATLKQVPSELDNASGDDAD